MTATLLPPKPARLPLPKAAARVLLVEDDDDVRTALRVCLEASKLHVGEACDGREALRLVAEFAPDIVLLDLGLPEVDGIEVLERIHALGANAPKVVVLSAWGEERCEGMVLELGAALFLQKPAMFGEILRAIRYLLSEDSDR